MKKLVKPVENLSLEEKSVETLCGEMTCQIFSGCEQVMCDSEAENDIVF